jgi:hypothetical protein
VSIFCTSGLVFFFLAACSRLEIGLCNVPPWSRRAITGHDGSRRVTTGHDGSRLVTMTTLSYRTISSTLPYHGRVGNRMSDFLCYLLLLIIIYIQFFISFWFRRCGENIKYIDFALINRQSVLSLGNLVLHLTMYRLLKFLQW